MEVVRRYLDLVFYEKFLSSYDKKLLQNNN